MDFTGKHYPKEVIMMVVRWYLAYPLSYRHVEELAKERGIMLDHATVQRWVQQYSGKLLARVCSYNRNRFTDSWRLDETYLKVKGKWVYLYRMVDSNGETIDFYLSKTRDSFAAKRCVRGALRRAGFIPRKINSDGSPANALAVTQINAELLLSTGSSEFIPIEYTKIKYCNNAN